MNNEITKLQRIENIVLLTIVVCSVVVIGYAIMKLGAFVDFAKLTLTI
jgi:hypothetical protein